MNYLLRKVPFLAGENSRKILSNSSWNLFQQLLSIASNSIIGIFLVRAMSVSDYGIYSYAVALCGIGVTLMTAGLSGLAVKEFVDSPNETSHTMSALLLTREIFAVVGFIFIGVLSYLTAESFLVVATLVASIALFGRAMEAPEYWYLANLQSKKTVTIRVSVISVMLAVRVIAILVYPNAMFFLVIYALEAVVIGALILARYWRDAAGAPLMRPDTLRVRRLIRQSLPLLLSSLAGQINTRGDIIVIQAILGLSAVSVYSAAARISEMAYFLPVIVMNSFFSTVLAIRQKHGPESQRYLGTLQRSYDIAFWGGVLVAICVYVFGIMVIRYLFGPEYQESESVLAIHVLSCPFIFMAAVYSKWIIAEGILWTSTLRHGLGAATNLALCWILIPRYGVQGAAAATFVSYTVASYLACFVGGKLNRQTGMAMTRAIFAPARYFGHFVRL